VTSPAGLRSCPRCGSKLAVRIPEGRDCAECESVDAWGLHQSPGQRLVIDADEIAAVEARLRRDDEHRVSPWSARGVIAMSLAVVLAVGVAVAANDLRTPIELGPLEAIFERLSSQSYLAAATSLACLAGGIVALIRLRRGRLFRSVPVLAVASVTIVVGIVGLGMGLHGILGSRGLVGWDHLAVPALPSELEFDSPASIIMPATVVVIATDGSGDSRRPMVGSGVVMGGTRSRAWIVTSRHVAAPMVAVGSFLDVAELAPVYVLFADGREATGVVEWVADPPVDVAMLAVEIDDPPAGVELFDQLDRVDQYTPVVFVPNPLRDGWRTHEGVIVSREDRQTSGGDLRLFVSDLPVQPGDSGGGLFTDDGRLIGINTWAFEGAGGPMGISLSATTMSQIARMAQDARQRHEETGR